MRTAAQEWVPIRLKDIPPSHKLYRPAHELKQKLDARARLEKDIHSHLNNFGEVRDNLQEAAREIVQHIKSRKSAAEDKKKRLKIIIPGRSGFISAAFLKAAIAKHGEIGIPKTDWILLDNEENAALYKTRREDAIKNARAIFKKHDVEQTDSLVVLDDYYGIGIKAGDYNTLLTSLGFEDYSLAYFSGYTGTTEELPKNVVIGSRNYHLTGLINGMGLLLKQIDELPPGGERLLGVAATELAKLV